jgi:hypothetical protein
MIDIVWIVYWTCVALLAALWMAWPWLVRAAANALVLTMWARLRSGK